MAAQELSDEFRGLLGRTGNLLSDLCDAGAAGATDAALPGLFSAWGALQERADNEQCTVAVLALAKSGKEPLGHRAAARQNPTDRPPLSPPPGCT